MTTPHISTLALIAAAALAVSAGAASAQSTDPNYDRAQQQYDQDNANYQAQQDAYRAKADDYQARKDAYEDQRDAYERARARYERDRAAYDERWGVGAYERRYGPYRYTVDPDTSVTADPYRGYYTERADYYAPYRNSPCEQRRDNNTAAGAVIGALAGAALGSNIAAHGVRTEGAILGAVVGGVAGGSIGRGTAKCDAGGYYFAEDQTYPYREADEDRNGRSGRYDYDWYIRHRCRLAVAPAEWNGETDYRYVRVCPGRDGYYRITE